jgi:hypothetical protein
MFLSFSLDVSVRKDRTGQNPRLAGGIRIGIKSNQMQIRRNKKRNKDRMRMRERRESVAQLDDSWCCIGCSVFGAAVELAKWTEGQMKLRLRLTRRK